MKWHRIMGFLYRHWLEIRASMDRKADVFFFPIIDILVFGFLSSYVAQGQGRPGLAAGILAGIVFWTLLYNLQRDMTFSLLDDVWSRNIFNLYASPLRLSEIIAGTLLLSVLKSLLTTTVIVIIASGLFHLQLFSLGSRLGLYLMELFMFGWAFGFLTSGMILRYGSKVQALAWSFILVLYPFSGALYPLSILPRAIAAVARFLPASYVFEGVRGFFVARSGLAGHDVLVMSVLNVIYLAAAIWFYVRSHKRAKDRGWFVHPT
jgi:ABC-2 type transport system permease protein